MQTAAFSKNNLMTVRYTKPPWWCYKAAERFGLKYPGTAQCQKRITCRNVSGRERRLSSQQKRRCL